MEIERFKTRHGYVIKMFFRGEDDFQEFMTALGNVVTEETFPAALCDSMQKLKAEIQYYKAEAEDERFPITSIIFEDHCFTMFKIVLGLIWNCVPVKEYEKLQNQYLKLQKEHLDLQERFSNFIEELKAIYHDEEP